MNPAARRALRQRILLYLRNRFFGLPAFLLLLAVAAPRAGAVDQDLLLLDADGDSVDLVVPSSGLVEMRFYHPAADGPSFQVDLGTFHSGDVRDLVAAVALSAPPGEEPAKLVRLAFGENEHRAVLQLHAPDLIPGVEYSGKLTASSPVDLRSWTVTLHRQQTRVQLATDLKRRELDVTLYSWWGGERPGFELRLFERSGDLPVEGLTIRRADESEAKTAFDIERHLRFYLDDEWMPDLTHWPVADEKREALRRIPPDGQRVLRAEITGLPRGEHRVVLELDAANAEPGTAPKVELVVRVRHSIGWALALLLLAIALSFFMTKGIVNWRQRLRLDRRTRALYREWLHELRHLAPVVWLKATRRQAEMVLDKFSLLPAPDELVERLDTAARLLYLLHRYRDLRDQLRKCGFPFMLNYRLEKEIDKVIHRIDPEGLSEAEKAALDTKLRNLGQGLADPVSTYKPLVAEALQKIKQFISRENLKEILDKAGASPKQKKYFESLMKTYVDGKLPEGPTQEDLLKWDQVCAGIRVLGYNPDDAETLKMLLPLVVKADVAEIQIERMFEESDKVVWRKVREAVERSEAHISPSKQMPTGTAVEALSPARFEVSVGDDRLDEQILLQSRMVAEWTLELEPRRKSSKFLKPPLKWTVRANGNSLVQFAPEEGKLTVGLVLSHRNQKTKPITAKLDIESSHRNIVRRLFAVEEIVLVAVSFVTALASGLVLYYIPNPSFGSLQDYLALFTWGVGVDQGKNLVQTFQNLRKQSQPPAGS